MGRKLGRSALKRTPERARDKSVFPAGPVQADVALTRKKAAQLAGLGVETLIFYEKSGLIPAPGRAANGYRMYSSDDVNRLRFIQAGKRLGFSLEEIGQMIRAAAAGTGSKKELREGIREKISRIDSTIDELRELRKILTKIVDSPHIGECDILKSITKKI